MELKFSGEKREMRGELKISHGFIAMVTSKLSSVNKEILWMKSGGCRRGGK